MFYCDPPGTCHPDNLLNHGDDVQEHNFILLHDQEPIHLDIHENLFTSAAERNKDLNYNNGPKHSAIVHSEYNSYDVELVKQKYNWKDYYYFWHGWAALDWYRGYNKTFLYTTFAERTITHTFLFPNNIVGGKRKHRLELLQELEKRNLVESNLISFPSQCPYEQKTVDELCYYYGIDPVKTPLPMVLDSFDNQANNSHEIKLWEYADKSLVHVVGETVFLGKKNHLTEKSFKPIAMQQPFVIASCKNSLQYLRNYGFETFSSVWDESYDSSDDEVRCSKIADLLADLEQADKQELQRQCAPIVEHNLNHFYGGDFERILWKELTDMLEKMADDFRI